MMDQKLKKINFGHLHSISNDYCFLGAFEQAGGLLNLYAKQKTNLVLTENFTVPASWFQSLNAIFIIIFASLVGSFLGLVAK